MGVGAWIKDLFNMEGNVEEVSVNTEPVVQEKKKSKVSQWLSDVGDLFSMGQNKTNNEIYKTAYYSDPDTVEKITGNKLSPFEVSAMTQNFWENPIGGIASLALRLVPGDFKDKIQKTESLFNEVGETFQGYKSRIQMIEAAHKNGEIDDQTYRDSVYQQASEALQIYNDAAKRRGLGTMTNFNDLEKSIFRLEDMYSNKEQYDKDRDLLKEKVFRVLAPKYSEQIESIANTMYDDYSNELAKSIQQMSNNDYTSRFFNGEKLSNSAVFSSVKKMAGDFSNEYNNILSIKKTALRAQEETPNADFSGEIEQLDKLLAEAKENHNLFLKTYINNVGKNGYQNIDDFSRSYEKQTGKRVKDMFSDAAGGVFRITDVRQAQILKDYILVKRDLNQLASGDISLASAIIPLREVDGKLKFRASAVLSMGSLLWGSLVTPTFKNAANLINNVINVGETTDFYNSGMGMLKSSAFNLSESKDYNLTDFMRGAANFAPDAAEFLIPIGKVASVQQLLWKGTTSAPKVLRWGDDLARAVNSSVNSIKKSGDVLKYLNEVKPSAWNQATRGLLHTVIDMNLINIPFETRNPNEYSAVDAMFDLSFNAAEVIYRLKKLNGPIGAELRWAEIKHSDQFLDSVYKDIAYRGMSDDTAKKARLKIASQPKELIEARGFAKNVIDYGESYQSFGFLLGIDPDKYMSLQKGIKQMNTDAYNTLLAKSKAEGLEQMYARGGLTELEMSAIVEKNIKEIQDKDLLEERVKFKDSLIESELNTRRIEPAEEIIKGSPLYSSALKIDSSDKLLQEEGFKEIRASLEDINSKLDKGIGNKEALIKERNLYLNRLDYYEKTKYNLNTFITEAADNTAEGGRSKIFEDFGFLNEKDIKNINENKSYTAIDKSSKADYLIVGMDNETIYPVSVQRRGYQPIQKLDKKTKKMIPIPVEDRPAVIEFYILKTKGKGPALYHIQDFTKTSTNYLDQRMFPNTSEGNLQALAYIQSRKGYYSPIELYNRTINKELFLTSDEQLEPIQKAVAKGDFVGEYNNWVQSNSARDAVDYINDTLSSMKTTPKGDRILSVFADKGPSEWDSYFIVQGDLPIIRSDELAKDLTRLVLKYPTQNIFANTLEVGSKEAIALQKNLDALYKRYRIIAPTQKTVDIFERASTISDFEYYTKGFSELPDSQKTAEQIDKNIGDAIEKYNGLDNLYYPKVILQEEQSTNKLIVKEIKTAEIAEKQGETMVVEKSLENVKTYGTIKYDYSDIPAVENAGKGLWYNSLKFVNRFIQMLGPQANDYLPDQFKKGMIEFISMNSNSSYLVDGKFLKDVIPEQGSDMYKKLVSDINSGLKKQATNALSQDGSIIEKLSLDEETALKTWKATIKYFDDMAFLCNKTFQGYTTNVLKNPERGLNMVKNSNEFNSIFYFLSNTDKNMYKLMTDPTMMDEYFSKFGEPITISASKEAKFAKINDIIVDLARQGKGNKIIRWMSRFVGPDTARRMFNFFFTGGAYIVGTTVVNPTLLPSQLFINGIGLTTDATYRTTWKSLGGDGINKFWKHSDINMLMKQFGILYNGDDFDLLPRTTNIGGLWKQYSDQKYLSQLNKFFNNTLNAGLYNFTEMAFDKSFKMQRILETMVADWGIKNIDEFNAYIKPMTLKQQQDFIQTINDAANKRYVYKTGNSFTGLEKFYFGNNKTPLGIATKWFMRSISLLANWGYTHVRSISNLLTGYNLNKIALANFESGKGSLAESKKVVQNLLNYNYDYEMFMNKFFFAMGIGRKLDRIAGNDIEEDNIVDRASDTADFGKYLYAPLAGLESTPLYRILQQTIGSAILANSADELDLNAIQTAGTTFLTRIMAEAKRRLVPFAAAAKGITTTIVDPNVSWVEALPQIFKTRKESTSGFGYFIDRDINYYGYEPDMPYTPHSELSLFMPERNKWKTEFLRMNTLNQLAELQKTDKSAWDYWKYRIPVLKDIFVGLQGDTTGYKGILGKLFKSGDLSLDHYVVNTPKRWNELQKGDLKLNGDLDAGEYVFNLLTSHAIQPFSDEKQLDGTKKFLSDMSKQYNMIATEGKNEGELIRLAGLSNKEALRVKNMFKLADQGKMATFFTEFTKADNNKQKQGLLLMAYIDAQQNAQAKGENVPGASRSLISSIAQDMYYYLSNKVKKEKGYPYEPGKYLDDYDPQADREIKYYIADQLGEALYYVDKSSWASLGRYYARDRALKEGDPVADLLTQKYDIDKKTGKSKLKYGEVKAVRMLKDKEGDDSTNTMVNNLNNLYMLSNILIAEGKINPDKFYVGLASILSPKKDKATYDPAYVNNAMVMAKLIGEKLDNSILPQQEKTAAKAGLIAAMLPMLNNVRQDVIDVVGEDKFRQLQDWIYGTFKELGEQELTLAYKLAQDGQYSGVDRETGTVLDMYNANGNYKTTYRGKDYANTYSKSSKYYSPIARYYRNNYNKIPKTAITLSTKYGKDAYYKNLYIKLTDAESANIPGGIGKGKAPSTGFTLKGGKGPIKLKSTTKGKSTRVPAEGLISRSRDSGLISGTRTMRSTKYPGILSTYIKEKGGK